MTLEPAPLAGPFRLDPAADGTFLELMDWAPLEAAPTLLHHRPTNLIFQVTLDPALDRSGTASPLDFVAYLNHRCAGVVMPPAHEVQELGRAAIIACLEYMFPGHFHMVPQDDDEIPF